MPSVTVSFDGTDHRQPLLRLQLIKAFSKHSVAVVDFSYGSAAIAQRAADLYPEWTRVTLTIREGTYTETWYGYVHTPAVVVDSRAGVNQSALRYTLIGTSLPMNEQRTRAWKNMTHSGVARELGRLHRMRTVVQRTGAPLPFIGQAGESDFSVLADGAEASGFRFYADNSTLLYVDPTTLLTGVREAEIRSFVHNTGSGNVIKWKSTASTMSPTISGSSVTTVGMDRRTKRVITSSQMNDLGKRVASPLLTRMNTGTVVTGMAQANRATEATLSNNRGWVRATAIVMGSPGMAPGDVVDFDGTNIPAAQRGLWLVTEATHTISYDGLNSHTFTTTLTLERDKERALTFDRAFRTLSTRDGIPCVSRNGVLWESEILESVDVG